MLEEAGTVYDEFINDAKDDLIEYFQENPQLIGVDQLININRSFFQQIEYHGVIYTIEFINGDTVIIEEKLLLEAFSEIHKMKFDKIFSDTAGGILYLIKFY